MGARAALVCVLFFGLGSCYVPQTSSFRSLRGKLPKYNHRISTLTHTLPSRLGAREQSTDDAPVSFGPLSKGFDLLLLNSVAVLWGTQHAIIKQCLQSYSTPADLNFWRFLAALVVFAPSIVHMISNKLDRSTLIAGCELGLWTFLGFGLQAVGLETTTASRSGFLLYLNVKFVPFFGALLYGKQISPMVWLSAAMALLGTILLSSDGSPPASGDAWSVGAACASAMFILRLEAFAPKHSAAQLNALCSGTVVTLCAIWLLWDFALGKGPSPSTALADFLRDPAPVLYLGVVTTAVCNWLQTLGQRSVRAEQAAIIYSLDPFYGALFARALLGEEFGMWGWVGSALILSAVLLSRAEVAIKAQSSASGSTGDNTEFD